jgi:predicted DCC family thiol-disulfide oxidoreductase YuxK
VTRLFYDGACGFCGGWVRFVARRDIAGRIVFAPLGGETFARRVPADQAAELQDTLVVLTPEGRVLVRSEAILHLLEVLGGGWRRAGRLLARVPKPLRDGIYRLVARLRSRTAACPVAPGRDGRFEP